jgi:gas vesicle protein
MKGATAMAKGSQRRSFLYGALAGGILGSITALLLAPKPGSELRKDIADGTRQVGERTAEFAGQVGHTTTRIARQVGSGVTSLAGRTKETAESMIGSVRSWRTNRSDGVADLAVEAADEAQLRGERQAAEEEELHPIG